MGVEKKKLLTKKIEENGGTALSELWQRDWN